MAFDPKKSAENYKWYIENGLQEYEGKWVAILNKKVIGASKNAEMLIKKLKNKGTIDGVAFAHIPSSKEALVYAGV